MTTAEILEHAAELIERDGWIQKENQTADGYCVMGAVCAVVGKQEDEAEVWAVERCLLSHLNPDDLFRRVGVRGFNDEPGRTRNEVCRMLRSAAAKETTQTPLTNCDPGDEDDGDPSWELRATEPILTEA